MLATDTLIPVLDERRDCLGHVIHREHVGVEAFNVNDISLGLFPDEREAAAAIWRQRNLKTWCDHDVSPQTQRATIGACPS
jgi:hypothetical protein